MSKHGSNFNERTPAPGVEEVVDNLRPIIKSPVFSTGGEDVYIHRDAVIEALTTHQQEKEALQEYYEKQMTDAYHSGFMAGQGEKEALVREILRQVKLERLTIESCVAEGKTSAEIQVLFDIIKNFEDIAARHGIDVTTTH